MESKNKEDHVSHRYYLNFITDSWANASIVYIPLGASFFGVNELNFGLDLGPAYVGDEIVENNFFLYGNLKIGYRF